MRSLFCPFSKSPSISENLIHIFILSFFFCLLSLHTFLRIDLSKTFHLFQTMERRNHVLTRVYPMSGLLLILMIMPTQAMASPTAAATSAKYQIECTMCSACDNPCNQVPSPPPPSPPPPSLTTSNCPPPPSPPSSGGSNNNYSPPPPSQPTNTYYSPPPPTTGGTFYPPPNYYNKNYPAPPPPNPIVPYFPFYYYSPPPPSIGKSTKLTGSLVYTFITVGVSFFISLF